MELLIRVDAGEPDELRRALALTSVARAWKAAGGRAVFAAAAGSEHLAEPLARAGLELERLRAPSAGADDAHATAALAAALRARVVLLAGAAFPAHYRRTLASAGLRVCVCAPAGCEVASGAELVLDPRVEADAATLEARQPGTRWLAGPRFALVSRELAVWRGRSIEHPERARRVLAVLEGPAAAPAARLVRASVAALGRAEVELRVAAEHDPAARSANMAWAELAVTTSGAAAVDAAFMGLPQLVLAPDAAARAAAESLSELGIAEALDAAPPGSSAEATRSLAALLDDRPWRALMSARARELVDGLGGERVARELMRAA